MSEKISYEEFRAKLMDADIPDSLLRKYLAPSSLSTRPLDLKLRPNPETVELTEEEEELEGLLDLGNGVDRWRQKSRFYKRLKDGDTSPVIVAEGDSWLQFPFLIDDVVDHLNHYFLVWNIAAAGDTAENMVFGDPGYAKTEYLEHLIEMRDRVKAFLFSGAGNDIIGENPATGKPVLFDLLNPYEAGSSAEELVNKVKLEKTMIFLKKAYKKVVTTVRSTAGLVNLPIIIHGYDYAIPGSPIDPRNPIYAKPDQWLGRPMHEREIEDRQLQCEIIRILIDRLYKMLSEIAAAHSNVLVVDVRGTLTEKSHWNDEIHATSERFAYVASKFREVINGVI